ncbi:MAG: NAD(+)/NADH kinase [Candidatus Peregrinibacteria bacterium]|nr:NAD(+)/NADH kinase [Candidatus Peregrinibacteria bacterium]
MSPYRRVGITVKSDLPDRDTLVARVLAILRKEGAEVSLDAKRAEDLPCAKGAKTFVEETGLDLLIVIGGDGTILRSVRELKDFSIPLLTINRGAVGFLAEMRAEEVEKLLPKFLRGDGIIDERSVLHVEALRGKKAFFSGVVLNEAVISQGSIARLVDLETTINDEPLTTFHSDGLIIATPTGSTAYSLAAGGPIVHPQLAATILTPINSHSFSQKPIVIPGAHKIEVTVLPKENKFRDVEVSLTLDGQTYYTLKRGDRIRATINSKTVKFLRRKQDTFFATLREKLKWGERVE